jgi:hypothetical protein
MPLLDINWLMLPLLAHCVTAEVPNTLPLLTKAATPPVTVFLRLLVIELILDKDPPVNLLIAPDASDPGLVNCEDNKLAIGLPVAAEATFLGTDKDIPVAALN